MGRSFGSFFRRSSRLRERDAREEDARDIPVLINNFNRLDCLSLLLDWLLDGGFSRRIVVLDNASDHPALPALYARYEARGVEIVRLERNAGALALWECGVLAALGIDGPYVYTDSDVVPAASCPCDAVAHLSQILQAHPGVAKVGLGLRIDDLPAQYCHRDAAVAWERQFWRRPAAPGLMFAPVDTTFALYRAGSAHAMAPENLRTTSPFLAAHLGWYTDSARPSEEEIWYERTARRDVTSWTGAALRAAVADGVAVLRSPRLMQVGAGGDAWPGWEQAEAADLAALQEGLFDGFHLSAPPGSLDLMASLHRIAKPNARLLFWAGACWDPDEALVFGAPAHADSQIEYDGDWAVSRIHRLGGGASWLAHLFAVKPVRARDRRLEVRQAPLHTGASLSPEPEFDTV